MSKAYLIPRRYEDVGAYLREARVKKNLTQREVADALGYSSMQFISNFERGIAVPPLKRLKILVKLYGLSSRQLVDLIQAAERRILEAGLANEINSKRRQLA